MFHLYANLQVVWSILIIVVQHPLYTVDYVVGNSTLASFMESCETLEDHPLNTSDHLPIVTRLNLSLLPSQIL